MKMRSSLICFSLLLTMMITVCGCSDSDLPPLGQVSGVVTLDGQPLVFADVNFTPSDRGAESVGFTNEKGEYTLRYRNTSTLGATVGTHRVTITRGSNDLEEAKKFRAIALEASKSLNDPTKPLPPPPKRLPSNETHHNVTVVKGKNQLNLEKNEGTKPAQRKGARAGKGDDSLNDLYDL